MVLGQSTVSYQELESSPLLGGFDIVIDPLGGRYSHLASSRSNPGCHHYLIGLSAGVDVQLFGPALLQNSYELMGFNLMKEAKENLTGLVEMAYDLMRATDYQVSDFLTFPLEQGAEAFATSKSGSRKVLLTL